MHSTQILIREMQTVCNKFLICLISQKSQRAQKKPKMNDAQHNPRFRKISHHTVRRNVGSMDLRPTKSISRNLCPKRTLSEVCKRSVGSRRQERAFGSCLKNKINSHLVQHQPQADTTGSPNRGAGESPTPSWVWPLIRGTAPGSKDEVLSRLRAQWGQVGGWGGQGPFHVFVFFWMLCNTVFNKNK